MGIGLAYRLTRVLKAGAGSIVAGASAPITFTGLQSGLHAILVTPKQTLTGMIYVTYGDDSFTVNSTRIENVGFSYAIVEMD